MNEPTRDPFQTSTPPSTPTLPPPAPPWRLLRARDGVLGGVCSGLAAASGLDVTLVRLATIVAGLSGFGVVAYIVLWVVVPREDPAAGRVLQAAPPDTGRWIRIGIAAAAIVGLLNLVSWPLRWGFGPGPSYGAGFPIGIALIALGVVYLWSRSRSERPSGPTTPPSQLASASGAPWGPPTAAPPVTSGSAYGSTTSTLPPSGVRPPGGAAPTASTPSAEPRRASLLVARVFGWFAVIFAVLGAAAYGVLVATGVLELELPWLAGLAALGAFVLLVVTTIVSHKAWPIVVSLFVLLGAGMLVAGLTRSSGGVGERIDTPTAVSEVAPEYELAVGRRVLDLSNLDLGDGTLDVRIDQGVGQVEVVVPTDAAVVAAARVDIGEAKVLGRTENGLGVEVSAQDGDPATGPTVDLDVDLGVGQVVVCRAGADTGGELGCGDQG